MDKQKNINGQEDGQEDGQTEIRKKVGNITQQQIFLEDNIYNNGTGVPPTN